MNLLLGKCFPPGSFPETPEITVPFLDVIPPEEGAKFAFIVMPLLYVHDLSPFETVGEGVDFIRQISEGLHFMHSRNVLHGDVKYTNIMANLLPQYDHPPHPMEAYMRRDFKGKAQPITSRTVTPVRYYLIDFDLSKIYGSEEVRLKTPPWGGITTVPEHLTPNAPPCDPFPVDVYCLGTVIKQWLMDGIDGVCPKPKIGFEFMRELVSDMTKEDPKKRPTMDEVMPRLQTTIDGLSDWTPVRSPVMTVGEEYGIFGLIAHWMKQFLYIIRGIPPIPSA